MILRLIGATLIGFLGLASMFVIAEARLKQEVSSTIEFLVEKRRSV